jgi:hypothetical protein
MKGIAIQTILLLLVGILVVGILVYLVYRYSTSSSTLSTTECLTKVTNWCTSCMVSGWDTSVSLSKDVQDCAKKIIGSATANWDDNLNCGNGCKNDADIPVGHLKQCAIGDCCFTVSVGC